MVGYDLNTPGTIRRGVRPTSDLAAPQAKAPYDAFQAAVNQGAHGIRLPAPPTAASPPQAAPAPAPTPAPAAPASAATMAPPTGGGGGGGMQAASPAMEALGSVGRGFGGGGGGPEEWGIGMPVQMDVPGGRMLPYAGRALQELTRARGGRAY